MAEIILTINHHPNEIAATTYANPLSILLENKGVTTRIIDLELVRQASSVKVESWASACIKDPLYKFPYLRQIELEHIRALVVDLHDSDIEDLTEDRNPTQPQLIIPISRKPLRNIAIEFPAIYVDQEDKTISSLAEGKFWKTASYLLRRSDAELTHLAGLNNADALGILSLAVIDYLQYFY